MWPSNEVYAGTTKIQTYPSFNRYSINSNPPISGTHVIDIWLADLLGQPRVLLTDGRTFTIQETGMYSVKFSPQLVGIATEYLKETSQINLISGDSRSNEPLAQSEINVQWVESGQQGAYLSELNYVGWLQQGDELTFSIANRSVSALTLLDTRTVLFISRIY